MRRGLIATGLSLAGLVAGAYVGSRVAPHLLRGGSNSPWAAVAGLAGAVVGALLGQAVAGMAASFLRGGLKLTPFRLIDSAGGFLLGAAIGVALVWVLGAAALLVPGQPRIRQEAQGSEVIRQLNNAVSPRQLLHLLARIDPFPSITGPAAPAAPPTASTVRNPQILRASRSVVRVLGTACGVGVEGSGWFASPDLVVTAAHVVAGETNTAVIVQWQARPVRARVVAFDARNDVAVLRVADRTRDAAPYRRREAGRRRGDRRLSGGRPAAADPRADRADAGGADAGRVRARSRAADDHRRRGTRPARRLGRTGDRRDRAPSSRRSSPPASAAPAATACRARSCAGRSTPRAGRSRPAPAAAEGPAIARVRRAAP